MGAVYLARDVGLDRDVAVKTSAGTSVPQLLRLRPEAWAMARVAHPAVAQIFGVESLFPSLTLYEHPDYGGATPTTFDVGLYGQREVGVNLDVSRSLTDRVHLAGGVEWPREQFRIGLGQPESWLQCPYAAQGFSVGSNGSPGFGPIAAGRWSRANADVYGDVELRGERVRLQRRVLLRAPQLPVAGGGLILGEAGRRSREDVRPEHP